MGRKEDEEDQGKVSKDTNGSCIEELTKKCKPVNVQLSRLELPKNGVILIKDNASEQLKEVYLNSNDGEFSDSNVSNVDKTENEENSNDTAETIKKIKEFIALGRCEETKKDQDSSGKKVGNKARVLTKRKLLNKKDSKIPTKKLSTSSERLSAEHELERTLKGQDSSGRIDTDNLQGDEGSEIVEKSKVPDLKTSVNNDESQITEYADTAIKSEVHFTPSRVSKRIQSKSVKFSVKKMLRGDDVTVLKRMIPGYQEKAFSKKDRLVEKKVKSEVKKHVVAAKVPSSPPREPSEEREEGDTPEASAPVVTDIASDNSPDVSEPPPETPEPITRSPVEAIIENNDKLAAMSEKIGKFAIGNGQITVELKGSQQKKVRIALPPTNTQSSLPNTSLGPDIIIKRVKPVKKTVTMPDKPISGAKGIIEKELYVEHSSPNISNTSKDNKTLRVNLERMASPKLKESLAKMQKKFFRQGRTERRNDKSESKEFRKPNVVKDKGETNVNFPDSYEESSPSKDISKVSETDSVDTNGSIKRIDQTVKNISSGSSETEKLTTEAQEESKKTPLVEKTRGRKTAKVTPLTQVKSKNETAAKKPLNKVKKPDLISDKPPFPVEPDSTEPEKETYDTLFDRYFKTEIRLVEHHDTFDSDSSEDFNDDVYAHFINLKKRKEAIDEEKKDDSVTMYDLMQDITLELPTWNIHLTSDGHAFCLAQVDIVGNAPVMRKVIEIDLDYNAKVFVEGTLLSEFDGNYSGYEDIRQLIYDVDRL